MMETRLVLAAQGLVQKWRDGDDIEPMLQSQQNELLVIEATAQLTSPEEQVEWLDLVKGDGSDSRRSDLAVKCQDRITQRDHGLQ